MAMYHAVAKTLTTVAMTTGPIMLAAGFGLMDCPDALCKAQMGAGPSKFAWAEDVSGISAPTLLIFTGTCKILAFIDVWITKIVPQLALFCMAILLAVVATAHYHIPDDMIGPLWLMGCSLGACLTYPSKIKPLSATKSKSS